jgi:hypothetical protein
MLFSLWPNVRVERAARGKPGAPQAHNLSARLRRARVSLSRTAPTHSWASLALFAGNECPSAHDAGYNEGDPRHPDRNIAIANLNWHLIQSAEQLCQGHEAEDYSGDNNISATHRAAPPVTPNVRDQRRRAVGASLAGENQWEPLAVPASGVTTSDDRCIALLDFIMRLEVTSQRF